MTVEPVDTRVWYATPGPLSGLGSHHIDVPRDALGKVSIAAVVVAIVQGLVVYDLLAQPFYGVELAPERADDIHVRTMAELLDRAVAIDDRPLNEPRLPDRRVAGRCHTYARLTTAILRAHGVPARARCGFGAVFRPGWFEDHWVAEYWNDSKARWVMVDAQLDEQWRSAIGFASDPLDLSLDDFVVAPRAWRDWRAGRADARRYGLSAIEEHGAHWIAHNLRLDVNALAKVEMLPWDGWGARWEPTEPQPDDLTIFDTMAELAIDPDARLDELRTLATTDDRVCVPAEVWNHFRQRFEPVA